MGWQRGSWMKWMLMGAVGAMVFSGLGNGIFSSGDRRAPVASTAWAKTSTQEDETYLEDPLAEKTVTVADPLQPINRAFFHFNDKLYFWVLKPTATVYKTLIPTGVRLCVRNAFENLLAPVRIVNNLLQLKFQRSAVELSRFALNSTLGVAGMFDPAEKEFGLKPYDEDFGQTLGHYGVGNGIFVLWPVFGPSTLRDTVGIAGDYLVDPLNYLPWTDYGIMQGTKIVNKTSLSIGQYEDFKASAMDPYVSMRDAYVNYRHKQVQK